MKSQKMCSLDSKNVIKAIPWNDKYSNALETFLALRKSLGMALYA
jgi:hypothetical protein